MNNVRELREKTGMNRQQFADYFGIPARTIQEWEQGRHDPPSYVPRLMTWIWKLEHKEEKHE